MSPTKKIKVEDVEITIFEKPDQNDFICITDIVKLRTDDARAADIIKNWLRTRSTIEFLGTWEALYNPNFKVVEFDHFRKEAGLPTFTLSVSNWIEKTGAIGLVSKAGRYGGTYAHKDIAFEFCGAINPVFKLYLIKEYQRLKEQESSPLLKDWKVKRILSKVNYEIHTDAVRDFIVPQIMEESQIKFAYTSEADMLNLALFHYTAKQWRDANPVLAAKGLNPRDVASISELVVMVNLESMNATLIKQGLGRRKRYEILSEIAQSQLQSLNNADIENRFRAIDSGDPKLLK
jgi:hypothetical protein